MDVVVSSPSVAPSSKIRLLGCLYPICFLGFLRNWLLLGTLLWFFPTSPAAAPQCHWLAPSSSSAGTWGVPFGLSKGFLEPLNFVNLLLSLLVCANDSPVFIYSLEFSTEFSMSSGSAFSQNLVIFPVYPEGRGERV